MLAKLSLDQSYHIINGQSHKLFSWDYPFKRRGCRYILYMVPDNPNIYYEYLYGLHLEDTDNLLIMTSNQPVTCTSAVHALHVPVPPRHKIVFEGRTAG
jgi:hypothetical protein